MCPFEGVIKEEFNAVNCAPSIAGAQLTADT
jgi:hypothetical protein